MYREVANRDGPTALMLCSDLLEGDLTKTRPLRLRDVPTLPTAYLALGGWFTGTTFGTSRFTHGLASSYLEGCNALTVAVSTPSNVTGHSSLVLWGPEAGGDVTRWLVLGGLWTFIAFHGALGLVGFTLRLGDIARSIRLRPYNALAFCTSMVAFLFVFLIYPLGQSGWFFAPSFGVVAILFFQGFHNWTLSPFHRIDVPVYLAVPCWELSMAGWSRIRYSKMVTAAIHSERSIQRKLRKPIPW